MLGHRQALILFALAAVLLFGQLRGQGQNHTRDDTAETSALQARASRFLDRISYGETENAFRDLLEGGPLAPKIAEIKRLAQQAASLKDRFGEAATFEPIDARRVGHDVVLLRYLYKCRDLPVVWHFTFYRTDSTQPWRVIAVRFDTDLEAVVR